MTTENVLLSGQWQQITTGTETKLLQCLSGKFALCESADEPPTEQPWHIFSEVVITPPSIVWVKTFTPGNNLVVTTMSSPAPSTLQEDSMQLEVDGLLPEEAHTTSPQADN